MVNITILKEINNLISFYEHRFGKEIDYAGLPSSIDERKLLQSLRIIVDSGDSVLTGLKIVRDLTNSYFEYLTEYHDNHIYIQNGFEFDKPCPLCNSKVVYYKVGKSYMYKCKTENCFVTQFRGI